MSIAEIKRINVLTLLLVGALGLLTVPMLSSCSKQSNATPAGLNTRLNIINISPDIYPINLWVGLRRYNSTKFYYYSVPSEYFYMNTQETPLQLRTQANRTFWSRNEALARSCTYTLFVTGLVADKTDTCFLVADTASAPARGRGKVRFINACARTVSLDVYANGTAAFRNRGFKTISDYIEIPAGIYKFNINLANSSTVYKEVANTTIQDGRLYTIYTQGVVGRTDSAAFNANVIINR
ncbi:DUF4397 domain-containing protein [Mucilaginibacter myungsuensis]|uniref:DUF4397 domain-containing protein n=1 Tax=Mucilaginibacter myungsuensis TaxID=649104 RepID=A0A929KYT2_9SPHI|nr:DUF4397 domain-containing protein [Mucilaginibacter myungsuensis]MBE9664181.1 DUF4397 domain-containing protein [Mucilaginibacter myungsuensis]MDN3599884.1 DUF4397 domain-containing protein [Mucilaginibacter myungsuensis]